MAEFSSRRRLQSKKPARVDNPDATGYSTFTAMNSKNPPATRTAFAPPSVC